MKYLLIAILFLFGCADEVEHEVQTPEPDQIDSLEYFVHAALLSLEGYNNFNVHEKDSLRGQLRAEIRTNGMVSLDNRNQELLVASYESKIDSLELALEIKKKIVRKDSIVYNIRTVFRIDTIRQEVVILDSASLPTGVDVNKMKSSRRRKRR